MKQSFAAGLNFNVFRFIMSYGTIKIKYNCSQG